ncbi:MAG: serine/threonine protein kinase [Candidatus Wallbacteria bacterium]|nr:serine/threonine protein kinase [Candidatus Wallbacteria bacterium]
MSSLPKIHPEFRRRFEPERELGAGGMGVVLLARDLELGRQVAIKFIRGAVAADAEMLDRFRREARICSRLVHPNVVRIYDAGVMGDTPYAVYEYVEGTDLARMLQKRARLPIAEAVDLARQVLSALEAAHDLGIVHRDIKPSNVLVTSEGAAKVTDFGIALWQEAHGVTRQGAVLGTPGYVAPEQLAGSSPDRRCDLYAAASMLYELIQGRPAFEGEDVSGVLARQAAGPPAPIDESVGPEATGLSELLVRTLSPDPDVRPASAREFSLALGLACPGEGGGGGPERNPLPSPASRTLVGGIRGRRPSRIDRTMKTKESDKSSGLSTLRRLAPLALLAVGAAVAMLLAEPSMLHNGLLAIGFGLSTRPEAAVLERVTALAPVERSAAVALGKLGDVRSRTALTSLLSSAPPDIASAAACGLAAGGNCTFLPAALVRLEHLLESVGRSTPLSASRQDLEVLSTLMVATSWLARASGADPGQRRRLAARLRALAQADARPGERLCFYKSGPGFAVRRMRGLEALYLLDPKVCAGELARIDLADCPGAVRDQIRVLKRALGSPPSELALLVDGLQHVVRLREPAVAGEKLAVDITGFAEPAWATASQLTEIHAGRSGHPLPLGESRALSGGAVHVRIDSIRPDVQPEGLGYHLVFRWRD